MMELQAGSGVQEEQSILPAANKKYKDTIFRMLFSDKKNLLSLYNALNGKNYSNCDQLEIVTLENAIYMSMKNDLAFILDLDLFLWEHQSTYNPNIPLRDLMYIAKEYEKYIKEKGISLYSSRRFQRRSLLYSTTETVRSENAWNTACPMHTKYPAENLHWS